MSSVVVRRGAAALGKYAARRAGRMVLRSAARAVPFVGPALTAMDIAKAGYGAYKRYSRSAQTEAIRKTSMASMAKSKGTKAYGRQPGTYSGKLLPKRKVVPGFRQKAQSKGFSIHFEKGGVITDPYCTYIGHGTCPQVLMRRLMLGTMLKALINKMGLIFSNVTQPVTYLAAGDNIELLIKSDQETASITVLTTNIAAAQPPFSTVLDAMVNTWVVACQGSTFESAINWKLKEIRYSPAVGNVSSPARIPLENAHIAYEAVSIIKIQNRSVPNADDDQADEVDRIPVSGLIYKFNGSGTNFKRTAIASLGEVNFEPIGEKQDGIFTYSAGVLGGAQTLREPPAAYNFVRCKGYDKVYLDPGHIKTSKCFDSKTITMEKLMRQCVAVDERAVSGSVAVKQDLGNFNLIALEKLMETSNVTPTQLITIGYEVDYKVFGYLKVKSTTNTIGENYFGTTPA